jgi:hypothetical protein
MDVNVHGAHGKTLHIWASHRGRMDIVRELRKGHRVDVSVRNKAGLTALDIARAVDLFGSATCLEDHSKVCSRSGEWETTVLPQSAESHITERTRGCVSQWWQNLLNCRGMVGERVNGFLIVVDVLHSYVSDPSSIMYCHISIPE